MMSLLATTALASRPSVPSSSCSGSAAGCSPSGGTGRGPCRQFFLIISIIFFYPEFDGLQDYHESGGACRLVFAACSFDGDWRTALTRTVVLWIGWAFWMPVLVAFNWTRSWAGRCAILSNLRMRFRSQDCGAVIPSALMARSPSPPSKRQISGGSAHDRRRARSQRGVLVLYAFDARILRSTGAVDPGHDAAGAFSIRPKRNSASALFPLLLCASASLANRRLLRSTGGSRWASAP